MCGKNSASNPNENFWLRRGKSVFTAVMSLVIDSISFSSLEFSSKSGRVKCLLCSCSNFFTRRTIRHSSGPFRSNRLTSTANLIELQLYPPLRIHPKARRWRKTTLERMMNASTMPEEYYFRIVPLLRRHSESMPFDRRSTREMLLSIQRIEMKAYTRSSTWKFRSRAARFRNSRKFDVKFRLVI